jgi:hypothetical protein
MRHHLHLADTSSASGRGLLVWSALLVALVVAFEFGTRTPVFRIPTASFPPPFIAGVASLEVPGLIEDKGEELRVTDSEPQSGAKRRLEDLADVFRSSQFRPDRPLLGPWEAIDVVE